MIKHGLAIAGGFGYLGSALAHAASASHLTSREGRHGWVEPRLRGRQDEFCLVIARGLCDQRSSRSRLTEREQLSNALSALEQIARAFDTRVLRKLIYVSSARLYGAPTPTGFEFQTGTRLDSYSRSHSLGEEASLIFGQQHNIPTAIVRLTNTFGVQHNFNSIRWQLAPFCWCLDVIRGERCNVLAHPETSLNVVDIRSATSSILAIALHEVSYQQHLLVADQTLTVGEAVHEVEHAAYALGLTSVTLPASRGSDKSGNNERSTSSWSARDDFTVHRLPPANIGRLAAEIFDRKITFSRKRSLRSG